MRSPRIARNSISPICCRSISWLEREEFSSTVSPPKNGQRASLNWSHDHQLAGAVAQLGERLTGSQEARGSSPLSSTSSAPETIGAHKFRNLFGWYAERAAAGEEFLITRRSKPYVRLGPAQPSRVRLARS